MKTPKGSGRKHALVKADAKDAIEFSKNLRKITGTTSESGAELILNQLVAMQVWFRRKEEGPRVIAAADLILEFAPRNATEALLAVQMFGVHEAALHFLQRATLEGQTFEGNDANLLRATRLMRLFNEQVELMAKLKGTASQQKVTVEHVHVHQGGQAIVGAVNATKDRGEGEK